MNNPKNRLTLDQIYALIDDIVIPQIPDEVKFIEFETENCLGEILSKNKTIRVSLSDGQVFTISPEGETNKCVQQNT